MAFAAAAVVTVLVATTAPAHATARAYEGDDYATVGDDRRTIEVCDMERDGNGVYGAFKMVNGKTKNVGDANGSAGGCANTNAPADIREFRVCEDTIFNDVCSWPPTVIDW